MRVGVEANFSGYYSQTRKHVNVNERQIYRPELILRLERWPSAQLDSPCSSNYLAREAKGLLPEEGAGPRNKKALNNQGFNEE